MLKELQLLGLSEHEAAVYEALVELGDTKAGAVIARLDIHRNIIYRALDELVKNGYVTRIIRNGVWHFHVADPSSFLVSVKRKEDIVSAIAKQIAEQQSRASSQIVVYEGIPSYRNYWLESMNRVPVGTVDYVAGGVLTLWSKLMGSAKEEYLKRALKKKVSWHQLYFSPPSTEELRLLRAAPVTSVSRVCTEKPMNFYGNFNVIDDTVIIHTLSLDNPKIIEMRDATLAKMFLGIFTLMWDKADELKI